MERPISCTPVTKMEPAADTLRRKTLIFTAIVIVSSVTGNLLLSRGLRQFGEVELSVSAYLHAFRNPWVITGILLLIIWLLAQLSLLSWADLSYVLPMTAIAYVLTALLGRLSGESVTPLRWIGILLITGGAILVGRTAPASSPLRHPEEPE